MIRGKNKYYPVLFFIFIFSFIIAGSTKLTVKANVSTEYEVGMYRYQITDEIKKEVNLIGITLPEYVTDIHIPAEVQINNSLYKITRVNLYKVTGGSQVEKVTISESFKGSFQQDSFDFPNVSVIEFLGKDIVPSEIYITVGTSAKVLQIPIIVPKEVKKQYEKILYYHFASDVSGDLTEKGFDLKPLLVSDLSEAEELEPGIFHKKGIIYQVIKSGEKGVGEVSLINLKESHKDSYSYLSLPKTVTNQGSTYELTEIDSFGLRNNKAKIIIIPDSVKKMGTGIFDPFAKLIFLSKNCKEITGYLFDYESYTDVEFISVPEGVTTIGRNAFNFGKKSGSIIVPSTVKNIEKNALSDFKLVTFLNKTPVANVKAVIGTDTTVKVNKSVINLFKKAIGSKADIVKAKDIIKSSKITLDKTSLTVKKGKTASIKATLTKGSNENVYWMSSDDSIITVSNKGVITGKKEGTAYIVAYTRTSGLHKAVKVTVTK